MLKKIRFTSFPLKVFFVGLILCALYVNLARLCGNQEYGVLKESPVNPEFLKYLQDVKEGKHILQAPEGYWLGHIPPPVDLAHLTGQKIFPEIQAYPTSYDLRTQAKLTSVKNQGACGSCWSFASYGSLESYLMPAENWNFAEQDLIDHHGFDYGPCAGGNHFMSSAYLARWAGPVLETDDPYVYSNLDGLTVRKHVQDVIFIPARADYLDNDNIKWTVMTYGAAYISFYWGASYFNSSTNSYYCNTAYSANHAVAVVGWDDNYDKNNFPTIPPGNGAFILKNSWGPSWGESGYFYLSYYDASFRPGAAFTAEPTTNYAGVYQYDPLGWVTSLGYGTDTAWGANIFTATASDYLKAVSTYVETTNASYELYIYTNVTAGDPRIGTLSATKTGIFSTPGYHTIILTTPVSLTSGQKFSLVVKFQTPGYNYPIPNERIYAGYSSGATSNPGESFISSAGTSWTDVSADTTYQRNICIKGFTGPSGPSLTISGYVRTADGNGLGGVAMSGLPSNPLTAGDGTYSDIVTSGWTGTVTPSKSGYSMSPTSRSYTNVIANQTGQDYTAGVGTCTYSISPTGQSFPLAGGTDDVDLTSQTGCNWTATSNDAWITINSGSSGTGSGTVNYTVSANAAGPRIGTMLIAGQTFTVTQAGTSYDNSPGNYQILPECIWAPATGGGTWISEVQITDVSGGSVVSACFNYGGGSRRGPIAVWINSGGANRSNKFSNFLSTLQSLDSGFTYYGYVGTVEFSTQDDSHKIQVVARTLNGNYSKTFPGFNLTDSNTADTTRKMMIQNYVNNATYRSTCGFFNPTSDSLTVEFRLLNSSGSLIGSAFTKSFVGYDFKAFSPFNEAGVPYPTYSYDNVFLLGNPTSGTGKLMCFGASANNITNDPAAHIAVQYQGTLDNSPSDYKILPEAIWAPATGGGTWVSEVQVSDLTGGSIVSVYFDYGGGARRGPFTLWTNSGGADRSGKFTNILSSLQSLDSGFTYYGLVGTLEFSTQDDSHKIQVVARTLNGNYSKTFPGFNLTDSNTADTTRKMMIQNYVSNATYRSTCGFFNPTSDSVTVEFRLLNGSGSLIGSAFTKSFVGYDFKAFSPFNEAGIPYPSYSYDNVFLLISPTSGTGKLMCFGASANNTTNDPASHITVQNQ